MIRRAAARARARPAPGAPATRGAAGGSAAWAAACAQTEPRCGVPRVTRDVDAAVAALPLDVVAGDQAAQAVPDDVHPVVAGLLADALDVRAEVGGAPGDVGEQRAVVPGADGGEARAGAGCGASRRTPSGCRPGRAPAAPGCARPAGRRRTGPGRPGGCSPGRLRASGRSDSVRVPSGYMSTWAPTQASSVRPPVRVAGLHSAAQRPPWRRLRSGAPCATLEQEPGPLDGRMADVLPVRAPPASGRGCRLRRWGMHTYVLRSPDGNAPVWRRSHRSVRRDSRSRPVRDRTGRRGNRVCPRRPHRARPARAAAAPPGARRLRSSRPPAGSGTRTAPRWTSARAPAPDGLVVGAVPAAARLAGALLVLAGLAGLAALFPTYLVVGGTGPLAGAPASAAPSSPCSSRCRTCAVGRGPGRAAPSRSSAWRTPASPARWPSASC